MRGSFGHIVVSLILKSTKSQKSDWPHKYMVKERGRDGVSGVEESEKDRREAVSKHGSTFYFLMILASGNV